MLKQLFFIDTWTFAYANDFNDFSNIENCRWKIIKPRLFQSMADPSITQTNTTEDISVIINEFDHSTNLEFPSDILVCEEKDDLE